MEVENLSLLHARGELPAENATAYEAQRRGVEKLRGSLSS
jgi:hypothetical protein